MSLFSIPVIALYFALEDDHRERKFRQYARKKIMEQMKQEEEVREKVQQLAN